MAALTVGDEQPPLAEPQVTQPQPEALAAAQPSQHHRRDHRPVAVRAQGGGQRVHLAGAEDLRQRPGHPDQRDTPGRAAAVPAGLAGRGAPGSPSHHRGRAGTHTVPTRSAGAAAASALTPAGARLRDLQPAVPCAARS